MFRGDDRIVCRNGLPCVTARRQTDPMQMTSPARLDGIGGTIEQIASEQYDAGKLMPVIQGEQLTASG
ncbi:hypothetical protein ACM43_11210 [Bradyrhizobium sp. CCBAU 45321]|nr:hypothetical protein [Bradyrhizobium sp. CCBAU 45321]